MCASTYKNSLFSEAEMSSLSGVSYKTYLLKRNILLNLATKGECTVADLSAELNVSNPTASKLVTELIDEGYVHDLGKIETHGGRRPSTYGLVSESGYFLGVEIQNDCLLFAVADMNRNVISVDKECDFKLENTDQALSELCKAIQSFMRRLNGIDPKRILGIGLNIAGRVNSTSGYSYNYFNFDNEPLSRIIEKQIGIRVVIENDTRAMAYAEFLYEDTKNIRNALYINAHRGVGVGIVIDGKLYYGKSGFSGEFGHIPVFDNEKMCYCGKKGCLETEASGFALENMFVERLSSGATSVLGEKFKRGERISVNDIIDAAKHDDVLAIELIATVGEKLGRGIAILVNLLNPELVVVGGTLSSVGDYLMLPVKTSLNKYSLSLVNNDSTLRVSDLGEKAGVIGSAFLTRSRILGIL